MLNKIKKNFDNEIENKLLDIPTYISFSIPDIFNNDLLNNSNSEADDQNTPIPTISINKKSNHIVYDTSSS